MDYRVDDKKRDREFRWFIKKFAKEYYKELGKKPPTVLTRLLRKICEKANRGRRKKSDVEKVV